MGSLPHYLTITGYQVTPVVALVTPGTDYRVDPFEVAEVFEVPMSFLMNPLQPLAAKQGGLVLFAHKSSRIMN